MIAAIKAEFRKLLTVRSTYILMLVAFALVLIFAFYAEGLKATGASVADPHKLASEVTNAVMSVSLLGALVGVMLMTHEYRYNTIMYTLTASNSRSKTLFAKIIVVSVFAVVFTLMFATLSPVCTWIGIHLKGLTLAPQEFELGSLLWRVLFYGWGVSMLGLMLAILLRNQIAVIVTLFMLPTTIESLLGLVLKHNAIYLPFTTLTQVLQHQMIPVDGNSADKLLKIAMPYGKAAAIYLFYLAVIWTIAWLLFLRRDAN